LWRDATDEDVGDIEVEDVWVWGKADLVESIRLALLRDHQANDGLSPIVDVDAVYMSRFTWMRLLTPDGYKRLMADNGAMTLFGCWCLIDDRMADGAYSFAAVNQRRATHRALRQQPVRCNRRRLLASPHQQALLPFSWVGGDPFRDQAA